MQLLRLLLASALLACFPANAADAAGDDLQSIELTVDGTVRTALVHLPATIPAGGAPLVFVFHGHGGNSRNAMNSFGIDRLWPEAISVYPQGLDTPGQLTDPEGHRPGWQKAVGDQGDRDLRFFDALLAKLHQDYKIEDKRVYSTGHSNGAGFTYLLWLARPRVFAAVAPCAGAAKYARELTPKPALMCAGKADEIVKFQWQELMIAALQRVNGCDAAGAPWEGTAATIYKSAGGTPLVTYIHDGPHMVPKEFPPMVVRFFQENRIP